MPPKVNFTLEIPQRQSPVDPPPQPHRKPGRPRRQQQQQQQEQSSSSPTLGSLSSPPPSPATAAPHDTEEDVWQNDNQQQLGDEAVSIFNDWQEELASRYVTLGGKKVTMDVRAGRDAHTVYSDDSATRAKEADDIRTEAERLEEECEKQEKRLQRLETTERLANLARKKPAEVTGQCVQAMKAFINANQDIIPDLQEASVELGAATRSEVDNALGVLQETAAAMGRYEARDKRWQARDKQHLATIADLERRLESLEQQQPQSPSQGLRYTTPELPLSKAVMSLALPFLSQEDWPASDFETMHTTYKTLRDEVITPRVREWLRVELTIETNTDHSAREQAAWLFQASRQSGGWSHADLQALAARTKDATPDSLRVVLAYLIALVDHKVPSLVGQYSTLPFDDALVWLRLFEFLLLHLSAHQSALTRQIIVHYHSFRPMVEASSNSRRIVSGMREHLDNLCEYRKSSLASCFEEFEEVSTGGYRLIPDGKNLIVVEGSRVRYLRPCHIDLRYHILRGWELSLSSFYEEGTSTTILLPPSKDNTRVVQRFFADALLRAAQSDDVLTGRSSDTLMTEDLNLEFRVSV